MWGKEENEDISSNGENIAQFCESIISGSSIEMCCDEHEQMKAAVINAKNLKIWLKNTRSTHTNFLATREKST